MTSPAGGVAWALEYSSAWCDEQRPGNHCPLGKKPGAQCSALPAGPSSPHRQVAPRAYSEPSSELEYLRLAVTSLPSAWLRLRVLTGLSEPTSTRGSSKLLHTYLDDADGRGGDCFLLSETRCQAPKPKRGLSSRCLSARSPDRGDI